MVVERTDRCPPPGDIDGGVKIEARKRGQRRGEGNERVVCCQLSGVKY